MSSRRMGLLPRTALHSDSEQLLKIDTREKSKVYQLFLKNLAGETTPLIFLVVRVYDSNCNGKT